MKYQYIFWLVFFLLSSGCSKPEPRKIEVLFLGHNSVHHNSEKYLPILASALANKGVNFTYTDKTSDINSEYLQAFDVLMIYANHDSITHQQETALVDFVEAGKGFMPVHCASWCFRNSERYVELVGAQFKSHGTGTFRAEIVNSEHPITAGYEPFESWDETYVSHKYNPDRTLLMERVDSIGREPWAWVRTHGKGRVFYTASGHDERTWGHPGFHELLFRGILWTAGNQVRTLWEQLEFPGQQYVRSEHIPNYEKRPQPLLFQEPFKPKDSEKYIQVPAGFRLELFASEPDIVNPMFLNWDEKGRLWIIESVDYPNEVSPDGTGNDRIKICEDTNGDGRADKFTVFADNLNIPTSFVFSNGGVIVSAAPNFMFLKDTNGDDHADLKQNIISGWGTYDTHAGPSNLKYGFDNYIWGTVGYSSFEGNIAGKNYNFGQGIYRFNPEVTDFEYMTSTSNNTWGLGFSETFDVFASTANNAHSWYLGIPDGYFIDIHGIPKTGSKKIAGYYAIHPVTRNIRQVDVFGGFTAAAGHNLYTARAFPKEYWNRMALICEPTGNLLAKGALIPDGAGFVLEDQWNLLASSDEWVSPVHAEVGPDGAVWVADWYNFIIQHNPTPTEERGGYRAETGAGNAHINPLRDRSYGRVYRISHESGLTNEIPKLDINSPQNNIRALTNSNMFWRLHAQRLLVERNNRDIIPELVALVQNTSTDELGLNSAAVHALWTIHGLGVLSDPNSDAFMETIAALQHPAPGVRKAAVQVLPKTSGTAEAILSSGILNDPDPHTQLATLLGISEAPENYNAGRILYRLSKSDRIAQDLWLSQALSVAANKHFPGFLAAYQTDPAAAVYQIPTEENRDGLPSVWDKWDNPGSVTKNWDTFKAGVAWEQTVLPDFNGRIIAYKEISLEAIPNDAFLHLGKIGQSDRAFLNGTMLHETRNDPEKLRIYQVPTTSLQKGMNYIALTITDDEGAGGLLGPENELFFESDDLHIPINGNWKYYIEQKKSPGINYSDFDRGEQLAARIVAYYSEGKDQQSLQVTTEYDPNTVRIQLQAVRNEMVFNLSELVVPAGRPVEILFENDDLMQHNVLVTTPGSLEAVGEAADELAQQPEGLEMQYVPDLPQVLFASPLIDPGESYVLRFNAPQEPGEYPFVCTFPGHWRTMNGILKVEGVVN